MISCGIATLVEREASFKRVIASISPQVDSIVAVLNNYVEIPEWTKEYPNLNPILGENEYGDAGKFVTVDFNDGYYFSIDDDLIYPNTYVADMIKAIEKYHCIVTLHGKRYDKGIVTYRRSFTTNVHCLHSWSNDIEVHVGGTGVMAFSTDDFKLDFNRLLEYRNMADVQVAKQAHEQGVKIMALAHKEDYLKYIAPLKGTTIWQTTKDDTIQTQVLKSFLK